MAKESSGAAKDFAKGMKDAASQAKKNTSSKTYTDIGRDFVSDYLALPGPVEKKKY